MCLVKPVNGIQTFSLSENAVQSKRHMYIQNFVNNSPHRDRRPTADPSEEVIKIQHKNTYGNNKKIVTKIYSDIRYSRLCFPQSMRELMSKGRRSPDYGWPSYSQLIIFTSSKNIFTSSKNIFTGSRNKTLAKATHN